MPVGILWIFFISIPALAAAVPKTTPRVLAQGQQLFEQECSVCHGPQGRGDGPAAYLLFPKPRNFTTGLFKIRSTPTGEMPTDEDLFRTISNGMPGSAMAGFAWLGEEQRWVLVAYLKSLATFEQDGKTYNYFQLRGSAKPVAVPPEPPVIPEDLAKGRQLYIDYGCVDCHGPEGKGDGPSAATLKDELGFPTPPNNFTRGIFKGGGEANQIYLRFTTGLAGTPMPSYETDLTVEERWALVHYVQSLSGRKVAVQPATGDLRAVRIEGHLPTNPLDHRWDSIPATTIPLMLLWQRQQSAEKVTVRPLHNGTKIALLLEWDDDEVARNFVRSQDFVDGAAIQWALAEQVPHFSMGDKNGVVNIWYWRADWQLDLADFQDIESSYPRLTVDFYPFRREWRPSDGALGPQQPIASAAAHDPAFLTGWGSGNIVSNPWRKSAVQDLNAKGFGTLSPQPSESQDVSGIGYWVAGKWRVMFTRSLTTRDESDVQMKPGIKLPVSFAVWDGSRGDRNGQKSITTWYFLTIEH